jgi:hypothetical protein
MVDVVVATRISTAATITTANKKAVVDVVGLGRMRSTTIITAAPITAATMATATRG